MFEIVIAPPHKQEYVRVRFFSEKQHLTRDLGVECADEHFEASFSPWLVGPSSATAPQVVLGEGWMGFIHTYALLGQSETDPISSIVRPAHYLPFCSALRSRHI